MVRREGFRTPVLQYSPNEIVKDGKNVFVNLFNFRIFAPGMKHATNIFLSVIMLTMILLGTSGVSVEKCSCTGKVSLVLPTDGDCCPGEGGCMTVKSMQLSDYMPTATASLDLPVLPMLFAVIPPAAQENNGDYSGYSYYRFDVAPPGRTPQTVTVLRV